MNNETKIDGNENISITGVSNSTVKVFVQKDKGDKKSSSVQKFYPKNFPQSLIYFTGREQVLENIVEALKTHGTAAFADTHGVGKSSVVIEFAYRRQETYKHILFIRATNNEFNIYVSEIVKDLGFALPEDAKPEQRLAVLQDWLATNQDWLLLVDNVDDVDFIHKCGFNKPNGKVIYTSNDDRVFKVGTQVKLPKLNDENAMLLLYKHWQDNADAKFEDIPEKAHPALKGIAEKFGNHPFSMAFVGSYLAEEDESLEEFLEAYQSKEKNLLEKYKFLSGYQYENVATAFLLRFEQISTPKDDTEREQFLSIAVKDYLKLSAYVGTDNIPEELLQQSLAKLHPDQAEWTENNDFIKAIYKKFKPTSIFRRDAENKTLTTHRIVQEIMRFQIKDEEDILLETLAEVLKDNFEFFDFVNKEIVERYLTHVGAFLEYLVANKAKTQENLKLENESTARLCFIYGKYYEIFGKYKEAEVCYIFSKKIYENIKDIDQLYLTLVYRDLAEFYHLLGREKEAEYLFEKSQKSEEKFDNELPDEVKEYYNNEFEPETREYRFRELIQFYERNFGESSVPSALGYRSLAKFYQSQGRYEEAKSLHTKTLIILKKIFGENHLDIADHYDIMAEFYELQDSYYIAMICYMEVIRIKETIFEENHLALAKSYHNLARMLFINGKSNSAKIYQQKSLNVYLINFGKNHLDTAKSYFFLGAFCRDEGKYQETLDCFYKACEIYLRFLPEEHPNVQELLKYIDDCERLVGK